MPLIPIPDTGPSTMGAYVDNFLNPALVNLDGRVTTNTSGIAAAFAEDTAISARANNNMPVLTIAGRRVLDAVVDNDGFVAGWVDDLGQRHGATAAPSAVWCLAHNIVDAAVDQDGYVIFAVYADGTDSASVASYLVSESGTVGAREVAVTNAANVSALLTYQEGDNFAPIATPSAIKWLTGAFPALTNRSAPIPPLPAPVGFGVTTLNHIPGSGQSLSVGQQGNPTLDTTALNVGKVKMFFAGIIPGDSVTPSTVTTDAELGPLLDLVGNASTVETGWPRAMYGLLPAMAATDALLYSAHGVGAQAYSALAPGTQPYKNMLRAMVRAKFLTWCAGLAYRVRAMTWVQGESDYGVTSQATYLADLVTLQSTFQTDARAISGRGSDVIPVFLDQASSWTFFGVASSGVTLAQMQAAVDHPTLFFLVGPKYHLPYVAASPHLTNVGYRRWGEYFGRAMATWKNSGAWLPCYAVSATRVNAVITVTCHAPVAPLLIDTSVVSDPGNYGVVYQDNGDGNHPTIASVAVSGSTVIVTLSATPTGTGKLIRFGLDGTIGANPGPTTGPRCCIHDSSTDVSIDGTTLFNWLCGSQVSVA